MALEIAAFDNCSSFKILISALFPKRLNLNKAKSMENIVRPVSGLSKLSESTQTKAKLILTAETTQPTPPSTDHSENITSSPICQECESIFHRINTYTSLPLDNTQQSYDHQSYGTINLGATFAKAANCHFCALLLSLFNKVELTKLNKENLEVLGEFSNRRLGSILIKDKVLRTRLLGDLNSFILLGPKH